MQPTWWRQRLDPDQRLGLRLTLAAAAVIILAVPLTATLGCGVLLLALLPVLGRRAYAWAAAGSAVIVAVTAYTRVALGVHWLSDVVGGIVLGVAVLMATTAAFETWRRRDKGRPPASPVREGVEPEAAEVEHMRRNAPR